MTKEKLKSILKIGETVAVEFKRCGRNIEHDVYETVCSFSNRFGGDIFLGVSDNGFVEGISEKSAPELIKNFISVLANPNLFSPTLCLDPEIIKYEGKTLIHIYVPVCGDVLSYKKVIYNRVNDSDIKVTSTSDIAQLYIRKQEIFTERRVYPFVKAEDLRLDLLPVIRTMAKNNSSENHPWEKLSDEDLLKSAGLYTVDRVTGQKGYNLAAVMLLGKNEVIHEISPMYLTDALVRKVNVDRYDDRLTIDTNLIESYEKLFGFAEKHLPDKFYLEDGKVRLSLRNTLVREMIVNTLMHREFSSGYQAKFIIEKDRMFIENANRARKDGFITPENLEPYPKNPIIASFFRNIGYSDKLGSGVRKLFAYSKIYSGKNPEFDEGDVFRITVPLDDNYSYDTDS
ncbi:MAG: putative DNA binding domain-containing protein, partial [Fibrobacter sp.]|nr:putative DNA binding domain-containing protein [Fibrobacter sp.]